MPRAAVQNVTILGATGSIGLNTLDVIARHPERYRVFAVTANQRKESLRDICVTHCPQYAVVADAESAQWMEAAMRAAQLPTQVLYGAEALCEVARHPEVDAVMAAIVGAAGMLPSLAAAQAGKRVLLANKEALVLSGQLFMDAVRQSGAQLLPIDSEHNAVFQSLPGHYARVPAEAGVRRVILTASGGPFRQTPVADLIHVTPEQACAHPNWSMGRKISVDSASMMNKGLEVIEAHWLFGVPAEQLDVVIHPQSVIHSMVEYLDGSVLAQLGNPDMRTPIAHALAYPERIEGGVRSLDFFEIAALTFERPDLTRFPCLGLAYQALRDGGAAAAVMNAANEEAVAAFLERRLAFIDIPRVIAAAMEQVHDAQVDSIAAVLEADLRGRAAAQALIRQRGR